MVWDAYIAYSTKESTTEKPGKSMQSEIFSRNMLSGNWRDSLNHSFNKQKLSTSFPIILYLSTALIVNDFS